MRMWTGFILGFTLATILWWYIAVPCDVLRINQQQAEDEP